MPLIKIATIFNIDLEFEIASVSKRIMAFLVDFSILVIFFLTMKYIYYGPDDLSDTGNFQNRIGIDILTISIPMLLYSLVMEVIMHGQTLGKKILGIRVINLDGNEPKTSQYITRWLFKAFEWPFLFGYTIMANQTLAAYILLTFFLGGFVVAFIASSKNNQRLGDLAANTVVVNTQSPFSIDDTIFMNINGENYKVKFPEVLKLSDRDINTIKSVINAFYKDHNTDLCEKVTVKVKNVLHIETDLYPIDFLEKLLADYNYLAS